MAGIKSADERGMVLCTVYSRGEGIYLFLGIRFEIVAYRGEPIKGKAIQHAFMGKARWVGATYVRSSSTA